MPNDKKSWGADANFVLRTVSYYRMSLSHYLGNPENISIMVLTCLELWV